MTMPSLLPSFQLWVNAEKLTVSFAVLAIAIAEATK